MASKKGAVSAYKARKIKRLSESAYIKLIYQREKINHLLINLTFKRMFDFDICNTYCPFIRGFSVFFFTKKCWVYFGLLHFYNLGANYLLNVKLAFNVKVTLI